MKRILPLYLLVLLATFIAVYSQYFLYLSPLGSVPIYYSYELAWKLSGFFIAITTFFLLLITRVEWKNYLFYLRIGVFVVWLVFVNNFIFISLNVTPVLIPFADEEYNQLSFLILTVTSLVGGLILAVLAVILSRFKFVSSISEFVLRHSLRLIVIFGIFSVSMAVLVLIDHDSKGSFLTLSRDTDFVYYWRELAKTEGTVSYCNKIDSRHRCSFDSTPDNIICEGLKLCVYEVIQPKIDVVNQSELINECRSLNNNYSKDFCQKVVTGSF